MHVCENRVTLHLSWTLSTCGGMQPGEFTVLGAVYIVPSPLGTTQLKGPWPRGWKTVMRQKNEMAEQLQLRCNEMVAVVRIATTPLEATVSAA